MSRKPTYESPWDITNKDGAPMNLRMWQETDPITGEETVHCTFALRPNGAAGLYENMEDDGVTVKSIVVASTSGARLAEGIDDGTLRVNILAFRKPNAKSGKGSATRRMLGPVGPSRPAGPAVRQPVSTPKR